VGKSIGIDFGTSNSGVAYYDGSRVHLLPLDEKAIVPEVVKTILYITRDQVCTIGQEAVELYYRQNVNRRRRFVKKWIGEIEVYGGDMFFVRDVFTYVDELMPGRLLQFIKTALRTPGIEGTMIFERFYNLGDIISLYLGELKRRAEQLLDGEVTSVTLGRPVKFSNDPVQDRAAQQIMASAAREAGFTQVDFELEPVAAALNYELGLRQPQNVLIFDFGGGTLDITIMRLGDPNQRQVYANGGIDIAGSDFDRAIIQGRMLRHFGLGQVEGHYDLLELVNGVADWISLPDLSTPKARLRLEQAIMGGTAPARLKALESLLFNDLAFLFYNRVEAAKIRLSEQGASVIDLQSRDIDVWELYTRTQFESDIQPLAERIRSVLLDTIERSSLAPEQIDAVVTTGGSSGIPLFNSMLADVFGATRIQQANAFSSVTAGLSIRAYNGNKEL